MRVFVIVWTQENRLRLRMMHKEHGLLHDRAQSKSYAVVREAVPTNWTGRFARAYVVYETAAQTVLLDGQEYKVAGGTVELKDPLNMVAKVRMPGQRGEDGQIEEKHLTAETIWDRTKSVQVRRLGNRRIHWFHALLFVSLGFFICMALVTGIILSKSGNGDEAPSSSPIIVTPGTAQGVPQSGPAPSSAPVIVVGSPGSTEGGG